MQPRLNSGGGEELKPNPYNIDPKVDIKADKSELDGEWVRAVLWLIEFAAKNMTANYEATFDLSDYLPKDDHDYEITIRSYGHTVSNNNILSLTAKANGFMFYIIKCGGSSTNATHNDTRAIIGADRKLRIFADAAKGITECAIFIEGYRKLGKAK